MAEQRTRPSYDQWIEKGRDRQTGVSKNESDALLDARAKYDEAAKAAKGVPATAKNYAELRQAKLEAAAAMANQRTEDERAYYADEIQENVDTITAMKAEQEKNPPMG